MGITLPSYDEDGRQVTQDFLTKKSENDWLSRLVKALGAGCPVSPSSREAQIQSINFVRLSNDAMTEIYIYGRQ